jgi:hypothetical protein
MLDLVELLTVTDHYLVKIKYRPRLEIASRSNGTRNVKFNMDRIRKRTVRDEYRQILDQQLDSKSSKSINDIEEKWKNIRHNIHIAAEEALGTVQPKKRNGWFDQDCQIALDTRNEARKEMLQRGTRANTLEYVDARKVAEAICRRKKKEYEENIVTCLRLQQCNSATPAQQYLRITIDSTKLLHFLSNATMKQTLQDNNLNRRRYYGKIAINR